LSSAMKITCDGTADSVTRLRRALPPFSSIMVRRRRCWTPMKQCGDGASNSAGLSPIACVAVGHGRQTSGAWTKCQHCLWRAVDQHGVVLDIYVRSARWPCTAYRTIRFDAFDDWRRETFARP
jgi:hypothetical protein